MIMADTTGNNANDDIVYSTSAAAGPAPAPTPAPVLDAGVVLSGADVGLVPGAPLRTPAAPLPAPTEEVLDVGLLRPTPPAVPETMRAAAPPAPKPPIASANTTRPPAFPEGDAMQSDIQKILGSIKLPERRAPAASEKQNTIPVAPIEQHLENSPAAPATAEEKPLVTPVHTLKDDIQHVVRDTKMSLVRAASLEEDRKLREQEPEPAPGATQRANRTRTVLAISGLLVVLGVAALLGVFLVMNQYSAAPQQTGPTSIIFAEQNLLLPLDNSTPGALKQQVAQLRTAQVGSLGSITRVIPTTTITAPDGTQSTRPATTQEFLKAIGAAIPDELARSLSTDFFFGLHSADKNAPVFVIPVLSYDNAFAGMLAWESSINGDLAPIFTPLSLYQTDADGIPHARVFQDAVIRNYDTRALSDDNNTIQLYYSFPSPNLLVIAESPYTFAEVISRLRAQRKL